MTSRFLFRLLGIVLLIAPFTAAQPQMEAAVPDIVIRGGRIIDGTGNPWYVGDIAITDGRIVAIGKISGGIAKRVIDARGMVVAPGFIDMLGQSETALLIDNRSVSKLAQGITSEITGEGGSIAPQSALTIAAAQPSLDPYHLKIDWNTLDEY
jgi:dihydroorotase/N-acyl-D-amino-acid deacylase